MSRINTPTNQKLLTNVAIVRIKKTGKRFEIACYKNKVLSWRQGNEKDLDEVLQSHTVFTNVSKGQVAKKEDLSKAFDGLTDLTEICKVILSKGDLQVSDKERAAQQDALFKDVANNISEKCVNPESKRPYPTSIIEKAMKECHICVKPNKNAKLQAIEAIPKIREQIPIERAQMRIKLNFPVEVSNKLRKALKKDVVIAKTEKDEKVENEMTIIALVDPGQFRKIDDLIRDQTQGKGNLELLNLKEVHDDEEKLS